MNFAQRLKSFFSKSTEGSYRGPVDGWSHWGNSFPISFGDGFQDGLSLNAYGSREIPAVYACVMAIARAMAMCYPKHIVMDDKGNSKKSTTSPAARVLRKPNDYETWPQFILNVISQMLFEGEAFCIMVRDNRNAITAMHLMPVRSCMPYVEPETGAVFYAIGSNPMLPVGMVMMAPARDVIHFRRYTPRHPLIGETDLKAAALAMGINVALSVNQQAFYTQMSRPSGVLSTDQSLTKDQMLMLRSAFEEQSKGMNQGRIPVLANGLKFDQLGINSQDAQLVQSQRMSIEDIARVFGVPLPVIGDLTHATMNNVEATVNFWLSTGLGSVIENVERSFDAAFDLGPNEYIELDVASLLRMDFAARVDGYTKSIQGGLLAPNEARVKEGLSPMDGGDQLYMQQQMIPLDLLSELHAASIKSKLQPAPAAPAAEPPAPLEEELPTPEESKAAVIDLFARKRA